MFQFFLILWGFKIVLLWEFDTTLILYTSILDYLFQAYFIRLSIKAFCTFILIDQDLFFFLFFCSSSLDLSLSHFRQRFLTICHQRIRTVDTLCLIWYYLLPNTPSFTTCVLLLDAWRIVILIYDWVLMRRRVAQTANWTGFIWEQEYARPRLFGALLLLLLLLELMPRVRLMSLIPKGQHTFLRTIFDWFSTRTVKLCFLPTNYTLSPIWFIFLLFNRIFPIYRALSLFTLFLNIQSLKFLSYLCIVHKFYFRRFSPNGRISSWHKRIAAISSYTRLVIFNSYPSSFYIIKYNHTVYQKQFKRIYYICINIC